MSTEDDGEEIVETHVVDKDKDGNTQRRIERETRRKCRERSQSPTTLNHCDIVMSGKIVTIRYGETVV